MKDMPLNIDMVLYILKVFGVNSRQVARRYVQKANEPITQENIERIKNGEQPLILTPGITTVARLEKVKEELTCDYIIRKIKEYEKMSQ